MTAITLEIDAARAFAAVAVSKREPSLKVLDQNHPASQTADSEEKLRGWVFGTISATGSSVQPDAETSPLQHLRLWSHTPVAERFTTFRSVIRFLPSGARLCPQRSKLHRHPGWATLMGHHSREMSPPAFRPTPPLESTVPLGRVVVLHNPSPKSVRSTMSARRATRHVSDWRHRHRDVQRLVPYSRRPLARDAARADERHDADDAKENGGAH